MSATNSQNTIAPPSLNKVISVNQLTESTYILRFERGNINFIPGQKLAVGVKGELDQREYSIYSGANDDFLEILVREVKNGNVSLKLKNCTPGRSLNVNGPFGSFGIDPYYLNRARHIFIATGTGISPFHSIIRSFPDIDYKIIHGTSFKNESYGSEEYDPQRYTLCTSREKINGSKGRVTSFLSKFETDQSMLFYLCGNGNMIYEVYHILSDKGVHDERIISEIYF